MGGWVDGLLSSPFPCRSLAQVSICILLSLYGIHLYSVKYTCMYRWGGWLPTWQSTSSRWLGRDWWPTSFRCWSFWPGVVGRSYCLLWQVSFICLSILHRTSPLSIVVHSCCAWMPGATESTESKLIKTSASCAVVKAALKIGCL